MCIYHGCLWHWDTDLCMYDTNLKKNKMGYTQEQTLFKITETQIGRALD